MTTLLLHDNLISKALEFATDAHADQIRKYTRDDYITHPTRVATIIQCLRPYDTISIAAALLHDIVEDTNVTPQIICNTFNRDIEYIVTGCTEIIQEKIIARKNRKRTAAKVYASYDYRVQNIKMADMIDNVSDLLNYQTIAGIEYTYRYIQEKIYLCSLLMKADWRLRHFFTNNVLINNPLYLTLCNTRVRSLQ